MGVPDTEPAPPPNSAWLDHVLDRLESAIELQRLCLRVAEVQLAQMRRSNIIVRGHEDPIVAPEALAEGVLEQANQLAEAVRS